MKGQIISGRFGEIIARQKSDEELELGELLVADTEKGKILLQVYDLLYGSQISQQNLELISGMKLEEHNNLEFMEPHLRNYKLAVMKNLITINEKKAVSSKNLPVFFSEIREVTKEDLSFLTKPEDAFMIGNLRSGTKSLDFPIYLPGKQVFSHHILITGTTGKGKSVLMSNLIWDCVEKDYCALLVLDPHDEYYGRNKIGLKDHPSRKVVYYTSKNVPTGARSLKINLSAVKPEHLSFMDFSPPQTQAMNAFYKKYGEKWVESIILEKPLNVEFNDATVAVLKRRIVFLLDLDFDGEQLYCEGIFDLKAGETTISDICSELEKAGTVIIDTSNFSGQTELLVGSLIASETLRRYKNYKVRGELKDKPIISVVLEEAPRVLGKEVLERGSNVFATIAREGRKFKVGLVAITQMPSLIPRVILANINTKVILGTEMSTERQAIIESASQDLSSDNRAIASLDKGEAIVSSNFARFALPIAVPFFDEEVKKHIKKKNETNNFSGVKIE
ncbi:MAG: ATP-binding protein [Nanoarchaeota archaeon]|nr:ATP-binding protein [Nanoarchaeota archaeon]MBU1269721.1 ATP-binding protein [Nanoarchaeota archaeon]MBU1604022.1 ATP-binding protein [Nanoarchaeota archaeon]MBU2443028.1 ATP-binding protein [Nanoarchaeota archaeon]